MMNKNETIQTVFSADQDGYFDIILANLKANTNYSFDFIVEGKSIGLNKEFTTMPNSDKTDLNTQINFVVSSYSKSKTNKNSWGKIKALKPQLFMMLGNMYDDDIKSEDWKSYESVFLNGNNYFLELNYFKYLEIYTFSILINFNIFYFLLFV